MKRILIAAESVVLATLLMGGSVAMAETNNPPVTSSASDSMSTNKVTNLGNVTVVGKLNAARNQIVSDLGATTYTVNQDQIESQAQGANAPFNQVILRTPGVAQDGLGQLHLRGEHANIQYRINDVLLPEGISGFGQEIDTRFVESLRLITGPLPAQYGFRTAGIVDIQTKSGAFEPGGEVTMYGGSYDTLRPSFEYGGSEGKLNYFLNGSYDHNGIGIENPTSSSDPIHDDTDQFKGFAYLSYILDDTSRLSLMGSASYSDFQLPDTKHLPPGTSPSGTNWNTFLPTMNFNSAKVDENQNEQNYYGVVSYQKSVDELNLQLAAYTRYSSVLFTPDNTGDLFFDGVASRVYRNIWAGGMQEDTSYALNDQHTIRGGVTLLEEIATANSTTTVFPVDVNGDPTGAPFPIGDSSLSHALFYGVYLQDEWKITPKLTLNYGARFDVYSSSSDHENQPSPRINAIYQATTNTTLHAGYARYFTPPPLENVPTSSVTKFNGTSNESEVTKDTPVKAERSHYFDAGIVQKLFPGLQVGVDGYYKMARNQLDDGLFGQSLIPSAFNYQEGRVYGLEFTITYTLEGFSTYANIALSRAQGKNVDSAQFLFGASDLTYIKHHWVYLDHDQTVTGSFGASYLWKQSRGSTRVYVDALYGSGLRTDGGGFENNDPTSPIPNGASVPDYYSVNMGVEQTFQVTKKQAVKARLDFVNVTDNIYQLRNGSGIGVNAAQYGMRFGVFGSVSYSF